MKTEKEIREVRTICKQCGYQLENGSGYKNSGLCYQCWVDRDCPSQEELEKRF